MRRTAYVVAALLALTALAAGCSSIGCSRKDSGGWETRPATEMESWLKATLGSAPWYGKVTSVTSTTRLGKPVVYVRTSMANAERDVAAADIAARATTATALPFSGTVYVFGSQDMPAEVAVGRPATEAALPAAPKNAADVAGWLEAAYGKTGEPWLAKVTGSHADEQRKAVVVESGLDFASADDRWLGLTVLDAVSSSGLEFSDKVVVLFKDGTNELSLLIVRPAE